jgi:pyridoxal phosphate enzyme (YggS family)
MTLHEILNTYPQLHTVVCVSKTRPLSAIQSQIERGFTDFGENRAQELAEKAQAGLKVTWHFIGRIQTNKLPLIVKYADVIHSVDALKQLPLIDQWAQKSNKAIKIYLQVNTTKEAHKGGFEPELLNDALSLGETLPNLRIIGLMVMGPTNMDPSLTEEAFKTGQALLKQHQPRFPHLSELSMGMSHDYELAARYGSTCFRLGTILFQD